MWKDLSIRCRSIFRRKAVEDELDRELRFHLEQQAEKFRMAGLAPDEALRRARLALGGLDQVKEDCREARGVSLVETVGQDLRYGFRGMRRSPGFTAVAVLTLGLGTGAISTVFTMAHTLLFRDFPVERADRVVVLQATRQQGRRLGWVSYPDYVQFRDQSKTLEGLAAHYSNAPFFVSTRRQSREVNGAVVSANFFPLLGIRPSMGRFFRADEDAVPDRDRVAVISDSFWRTWFDASPDVLGRPVKVNGVAFTVIGVAPASFRGLTIQPVEIYIPTMMLRAGVRWCEDALAAGCGVLSMVGRLAEGRSIEETNAEAATIASRIWERAGERGNTGATAVPARGVTHPNLSPGEAVRFLTLLTAVAGLLLTVCAANLAGLLMARNSARGREIAIRASLGAGSGRLIRQLVTESVMLAVMGGAVGLLFSLTLTSALHSRFYSVDVAGHPLYYNFSPSPAVILAALAVAAAAGVLLGLLPAWKAIRSGAAEGLKRQSTAVSPDQRTGRWLVGAQTAIAVALAGVAGLLAGGASAQIAGIHFDASHVALLRLRPDLVRYSPERAQGFERAVMERLQAVPGVESVSVVGNGAVLVGRSAEVSLPGAVQAVKCGYLEIGPRYFETLRTPVLSGREFDGRDSGQALPGVVVNETAARRFFPDGRAIGASLLVNRRTHLVIGIVQDVPLQERDAPPEPYVYVPIRQNPQQVDARLAVRVKGDPAAMLPALVREASRVDPEVPVVEPLTLRMQMEGSLQSLRVTSSFVSYAAALAVFLSAIGLYAALAFSVSRRTREIGIRMAVGARAAEVGWMVMREGMGVVLAGVVAGVGLAVWGARWIRHLLYGTGVPDAYWYAAAGLLVAAVGLAACGFPARRAVRVEPIEALREQ